jgi:hypothetical protein
MVVGDGDMTQEENQVTHHCRTDPVICADLLL